MQPFIYLEEQLIKAQKEMFVSRESDELSEEAHIEDVTSCLREDGIDHGQRLRRRELKQQHSECEPGKHLDNCTCDDDYQRMKDEAPF